MTGSSHYRHAAVLGLAAFVFSAGCQALFQPAPAAEAQRRIHYVVIDDGVSDGNVRVQVGEEVRWVNVRTQPVSVVFNGLRHEELSCEHGFSNSTNAHLAAVILPDDNVSLCFSAAGRHTYRVLDASRPGVELNHEAAVEIMPLHETRSRIPAGDARGRLYPRFLLVPVGMPMPAG